MRGRKRERDFVVTEKHLQGESLLEMIRLCNLMSGPEVKWDVERKCYGLKAKRCYRKGEAITEYGGVKTVKPLDGDYVAKSAEVYIDGRLGFKISQKGRWINESDRDRRVVNVKIGRVVRATRDIADGEWLFADYGPQYQRTY